MCRPLGFLACLTLVLGSTFPAFAAEGRSADAILQELNALKPPTFDATKREDRDYFQKYMAEQMDFMKKRADLAGELFKVAPDHPMAAELMRMRWQVLMRTNDVDRAIAEAEPVFNGSTPLAKDAGYFLAIGKSLKAKWDYDQSIKAIEAFEARFPEDEMGATLLNTLANQVDDPQQETALYARIAEKYPKSRAAAAAKGQLRRAQGVGKPFELSFTDAISGKRIDMKDLKGKVVVVDFWATWCGPCVAEMPKMKQLYAEFKDKGVEFIGVSLDQSEAQGGLEKLKAFVAKNEIAWPQYYQGNYWDSEFSKSWGINSIPAVFVVDKQGNLYSHQARGKLEQMIPELLGK